VQLAEAVASRFRLSGAQKKRLALAAARDNNEVEARPLAYRLGVDAALDRLLIAGINAAPLRDWAIPEFPLKGGEIVARGIKAGPEVARVLRRVESGWIAAGFADAVIPALLDAELSEQA
jgi:poly(A) polymerase